MNDLNLLAADAFQYTQRPAAMGGGDGTYDGYAIPSRYASNENASYSVGAAGRGPGAGTSHGNGQGFSYGYGQGIGGGQHHTNARIKGNLTLVGTSSQGYGTVTMSINDSARVTTVTFTGKFQ